MKQAEINFCEMWMSCAKGGILDSDRTLMRWERCHDRCDLARDTASHISIKRGVGYELTPRGADLIASYEHALAHDLPIVPDDREVIDASYTVPTMPCPDCEGDGRVPISKLNGRDRTIVELVEGEPAGVATLPGWDVTCPRCKGSRMVEVRDIPPAEWVTGEDEIWEMVRSIGDEIIDARWLGGEDLSIAGDFHIGIRAPFDQSVRIRVDGGHYVWFWTSGRPDPERPVLTAVRRMVS